MGKEDIALEDVKDAVWELLRDWWIEKVRDIGVGWKEFLQLVIKNVLADIEDIEDTDR